MNPLEALAESIQKLERCDLQWTYHPESREILANGVLVAADVLPPDGERIVMLHGTIKAQLAILDEGVRTVEQSYGNPVTPAARRVVDLARSILGEAS